MISPTEAAGISADASDVLVLASVASDVEADLIDKWVREQRQRRPDSTLTVLRLPHGDPPVAAIAELTGQLETDESRSVMPVRVFWPPDRNSNFAKIAGVLTGRHPDRPSNRRQRSGPARRSHACPGRDGDLRHRR